MTAEHYRTLFEDFANYRTHDRTIVQAIWTGTRPNADQSAAHFWVLVPQRTSNTSIINFWEYEVKPSGQIIVCYIINAHDADFPSWVKTDILALLAHVPLGAVAYGMTDLTIADFTKVD